MTEKVAVIGSRRGADLEHVSRFLVALMRQQPDTVVISGGADGVDKWAERTWLSLGGRVVSLRPYKLGEESYGIERWELGGSSPRTFMLDNEPIWADRKSAILYRDMLVAEVADRVVAFYRPGRSRGTAFTCEIASSEAYRRPTYEFEEGL